MMTQTTRALLLGLGLLLVVPATARTFTDRQGRAIEAELVDATATTATIKRTDGQVFDVPLTNLSDADRAYVAQWLKTRPAPALDVKLEFSIQSTILKQDTSRDTAFQRKSEERAYIVRVKNRSFNDTPNLDVEYRLFAIKDQRTVDSRSALPLHKVSGRSRLAAMRGHGEAEFTTSSVELDESKLRSGWSYADGSKKRVKDELHGLWVRVTHAGKTVAEWSQPASLPTKETW